MNSRNTQNRVVRYSPKPIEQYADPRSGLGPTRSKFLAEDLLAWNLAFLSHPFETAPMPPDAKFSTHVRWTLRADINTGIAKLAGIPLEESLGQLFMRPAPFAVRWLLVADPPQGGHGHTDVPELRLRLD